MKKTQDKAPNRMRLATAVSQRVEIRDIVLLETSAKRKSLVETMPNAVELHVAVHSELDEKKSRISVLARFRLVARDEGTPAGSEGLRIEAAFLLSYAVASITGLSKEHIDAFGAMNGVFNVWPYWREYVQSTTVRMGLPALTVPSLKLDRGPGNRSPHSPPGQSTQRPTKAAPQPK